MTNAAPYEFGRLTRQCAATGRALAPGEPYVAALFESHESEALERRDYSAEAWDSPSRPARVFAHWRATVPAPNARPRQLIDDDALISLFEQLEAEHDAKRLAFRFALALILIRKRVLIDAGRREDRAGGSVMLVRARADGPEGRVMEVADPGMNPATIAEVTDQVSSLIRAEG